MRLRSTERVEDRFPSVMPEVDDGIEQTSPHMGPDVDPLIAVFGNPGDRVAVQARDIQSSLAALSLPCGSRPASIAIIGVDADEETAVLMANVAASAALAGLRTLLVDMTQSGFVQHRLMRVEPLAARADHVEDLYRIVQPSSIPGLSLMAMAIMEDRKDDMSAPCAFAERLAPLAAHFDLCLVDASHADDLAIAATSAQAAILAIRRDGTTTASLKATIHKLAMLKTPVIGTVMLV